MRPGGPGRVLLIDVEILIWRAAWRAGTDREALARLDRRLDGLMKAHRASERLLALSSGPSFRKALWPRYKAGRPPPLQRVAALRATVAARDEAVAAPTLEADDVIGVLATGGAVAGRSAPSGVILSADKDLLCVLGLHGDDRGGVRRITRAEADRAHLLQTLTGDRADGFPGCPGTGPRRAEKLLSQTPAGRRWSAVLAAFRTAGLSAEAALTQARLARILRAGELIAASGRPRLWLPDGAT